MTFWSKEKIIEFLELYRKQECLWKIKSKEYSNRFLKEKSYQLLLDFVRESDKTADKDSVIKKINNLRGSFRKELKKVESSKLSGSVTDEVYEPKLWYYEHLIFLRDQEITRPVITSLEPNPFGPTPESPEPNEDTFIEDEDEISQVRLAICFNFLSS